MGIQASDVPRKTTMTKSVRFITNLLNEHNRILNHVIVA